MGSGRGCSRAFGVGLLGGVFALLGGDEKLVIATDDLGLDVAPDAVEGAGGGAGFLHVVDAGVVEFTFEVGAEAGRGGGFRQGSTA